jgi:ABC-2 type transport system ATP-binding protein
MLLALQGRGVTLVLTSHILDVVEKLCPLLAILDEGRLKGFGPLDALRADAGHESLEAVFVGLVGGVKAGSLSWL